MGLNPKNKEPEQSNMNGRSLQQILWINRDFHIIIDVYLSCYLKNINSSLSVFQSIQIV